MDALWPLDQPSSAAPVTAGRGPALTRPWGRRDRGVAARPWLARLWGVRPRPGPLARAGPAAARGSGGWPPDPSGPAHATRPGDQTTKGSIQYVKKRAEANGRLRRGCLPGWPGYQVSPAAWCPGVAKRLHLASWPLDRFPGPSYSGYWRCTGNPLCVRAPVAAPYGLSGQAKGVRLEARQASPGGKNRNKDSDGGQV